MMSLILAAASDVASAADHATIHIDFYNIGQMLRYAISMVLIAIGVFFVFAGALGVLRLPDFFTRMHAAGMTDTLGVELILLGLILQSGFTLLSLKFLLVAFFLLLTSPTATHAIADAAYHAGLKPLLGRYRSPSVDELRSGKGDAQ
ncbi:MAG: monovalent cation/H(+) antiporter subunit G [Maricaulaceae bacterium]